MAFLGEEFNLHTLPVATNNFDPLPGGWYTATITNAEVKQTKAGDGKYIAVKYTVNGPTHQGRIVFGNLNINNASAKAEQIGRQQLGEIMKIIGISSLTDSDQLIGGNLGIKLVVKTGDYPGNEIKGFKGGSSSAVAEMPIKTAASFTPGKAPPWVKK